MIFFYDDGSQACMTPEQYAAMEAEIDANLAAFYGPLVQEAVEDFNAVPSYAERFARGEEAE